MAESSNQILVVVVSPRVERSLSRFTFQFPSSGSAYSINQSINQQTHLLRTSQPPTACDNPSSSLCTIADPKSPKPRPPLPISQSPAPPFHTNYTRIINPITQSLTNKQISKQASHIAHKPRALGQINPKLVANDIPCLALPRHSTLW